MTPAEFKAWFDGFTEAFTGCPTKAQWTRIKERVAEIDGRTVTERVYFDRYWRDYNWQPYWQNLSANAGGVSTVGTTSPSNVGYTNTSGQFDNLTAMNALGRADAEALAS